MENLLYRCCFCGKTIKSTNVDPCDLNVLINCDKPKGKQDNQSFYCHISCFREKLDKTLIKLLVVDLVEEED